MKNLGDQNIPYIVDENVVVGEIEVSLSSQVISKDGSKGELLRLCSSLKNNIEKTQTRGALFCLATFL